MHAPTRPRKSTPAAARTPGLTSNGALHPPILDPIITMNGGGIIQSASDSVEQVFGWTPEELFGRNVRVLIPEPRRSALDRYLDRYRQTDGSKTHHRSRRFGAVRKDGTIIQIELSMSRADLPVHAAPYFIGIVRDVTRHVDVGVDPARERTRLQHLVTEQTRALATANLRLHLADRLASLGTLAAGLGHDMNGVLLPVRARLDAIEHAGIPDAAHGHVTAVRQCVDYLQRLSDGLQFLALDPEGPGAAYGVGGTTDLARWWSQVGPLLRKAVPRYVTLRESLAPGLPAVGIAPHWLTQAVLNLIVNAGEAIPEGRRPGRVRIAATAADDGRTVRLAVTDNGRGMAPGIQRRAFDLFFTTKSRSMGTGLGLPLARKVAVRAGGDIEITSNSGRGTTVTLILPVAPRRPAKRRGQPSAVVSAGNDRTAALISQVLIAAGVRVRTATGDRPGNSDLWVTRPTTGALATARRWRERDGARSVALLGAPSRNTRAEWADLGATVIEFPADFETIRYALGEAMAGWSKPGERAST